MGKWRGGGEEDGGGRVFTTTVEATRLFTGNGGKGEG